MRKTSFGEHHTDQTTLLPAWKMGATVEVLRGGTPTGLTGVVQGPVSHNLLMYWVRIDQVQDPRYARSLVKVGAADLRAVIKCEKCNAHPGWHEPLCPNL